MMSLFFVLSCFLLAMVPTAFGSYETDPPPTSSPSIANILVDGDKSVTLKVTTITYINAKNSTTVVPILTLSTVVEEIAQESVAVLTVPASPASETTSAPTPSVSTVPTPSSPSSSQRGAQNNANGGMTHDEPSPITFASSEHNGAQATPTSSSTVEVISVVDLVSTARAQGAVDAQATVDTSTTPVIETTFTVLATDDAQDKPSVHVRDWNAAERTRRVSPSDMFNTLYGPRKPSNPTNGPPITRALRDFPFLGKTTLVGTREPSTLTHGNRIRENQDGMDPIQARSTLSTSASASSAPTLDQDLEPHAKRSNDTDNTDNTDNIDTNEMGNMNVNVSHATEGFWDGVAEGANKFFDGVAEGASKFFCWLLPFTCHH
ncbi:uncharacterized protein B0T23DRAFT_354757 [Neurospora hispaniola]|uniref:Uncharacterized protein n=1 Tax=Neurospora hispaniola TaxID=588809 RepID=A0AAJ0MUH6_9PEZI|nr:hypothetical protein B0T23DRAFT_354757 [Neurospora hispaniola]